MRVALLNKNPAVSRLATLGLKKLGYEVQEVGDISELNSRYDLLICDSGLIDEKADYSSLSDNILYLLPKDYENRQNKKIILEKPFLPTDFVSLIEKIIDKNSDISFEKVELDDSDINYKESIDESIIENMIKDGELLDDSELSELDENLATQNADLNDDSENLQENLADDSENLEPN